MSAAESKSDSPEFMESETRETHMVYDESSRVPWWVVFVWVCAISGFALYCIRYLFPDLALWGAP
ncbi:MAG: hypothetical protein U0441_01370 [Polyangiaceae bacterium]